MFCKPFCLVLQNLILPITLQLILNLHSGQGLNGPYKYKGFSFLLAAGKLSFTRPLYYFFTFTFFLGGGLFTFHPLTTQTPQNTQITIEQFWRNWAILSILRNFEHIEQFWPNWAKQFHLVTIGFTNSCFTCGSSYLLK